MGTLRFGVRAKSIKNKARVNAELSPAELKALLKKAKADADKYQSYIASLEAELKTWRSGGKVAQSDWAALDKVLAGEGVVAPRPQSQNGLTRPTTPALEGLRDLQSRPDTPSAVSMDKDEREDFLRRENELSDQVAEKESALNAAESSLREAREELGFYKEQDANLSKENKSMASEINEIKLQLERVTYEHKEANITMDILKEQNQDLSSELEELRKSLTETSRAQKDPSQEGKERKKAEKMAKMMADFNAGIVSEKEEQIRETLSKLESVGADGSGGLSADDLSTLREQLLESQTLVREQQERVRQAQEENELLLRRRDEMEARLATLESEYEELLDKTIQDEESNNVNLNDTIADLKGKLETQYASRRDAQASEIADLKRQIELKAKETGSLAAANESLRNTNEELKRAFAVTAAGVEGGKNLAESAREMERVRKTMATQLSEFDTMKKSLMRDLQNRCEKVRWSYSRWQFMSRKGSNRPCFLLGPHQVVELEISLDESKEQYNNVVRSSNSRAQQKKMAFLERNLEQLTAVQKQLVEQNSSLKKEVAIAERKLIARNERIQALEAHLIESQEKLALQNRKFDEQLQAVKERLNTARELKPQAGGAALNFGRIAKPLRGGGPAPSGPQPSGGAPRHPGIAGAQGFE